VFCGATRRNGSTDCRRPSGWGTDHPGWGRCKLHAGSTQAHGESAALARAQATAQLFGVPRDVDPITGMLETYHQTMGLLDAIEAMCLQLVPAEVVWGVVKEKRVGDGEPGDDDEGLTPVEREYAPGINIWVKLLAEWHDRAFSEAERILKLGLDSRRVELAQSHVAAIVAVLLSPDLALSDDQRRAAARIMRTMDQRAAIEAT
jgi:hypothetical protein